MQLLRLCTAGSVDDGKSTLIGRLLYDSKSIFEDQLEAVERDSLRRGIEHTDLALLTDGLRAEREQGITIDVAYRYFATPKRKFIIADTPGHVQYTRNMVTGASTADLALILIDARKGVVEQSRRHAFISSLLGIKHFVVCVNKMDLVDWEQERFNDIRQDFSSWAMRLGVHDISFIPISALHGDNVVNHSLNAHWYDGLPLLRYLEEVYVSSDANLVDVRLPIQYAVRPRADVPEWRDYRGYAGTVSGGVLRPGDEILVLPSGFTTRLASIETADGEVAEAYPPMAVVVTLADDLDVGRGDMLVRENNRPTVSQDIHVMLCWLTERRSLTSRTQLLLQHTTKSTRAEVREIIYRMDVNTLHRDESQTTIQLNDLARVTLRTMAPIYTDDYSRNRSTGSLVLVDPNDFSTVAAGLVVAR